ncbi:MFS transporter [Rhodococcus jostii]|uniref:Predicted arabinose efflux permease, MFS family n=1 Tax=Rhodococcus jostii TaxID=132919 RepID=A0A1H4IJD6_RHOJO|nr:MFS transporter [Rhodococcus jostii]SEB34033.1 Predicted arabinose efflux permease, MFS family [Rhodococcus jostii]
MPPHSAAAGTPVPESSSAVKRSVFASTVGAGIEWYDFMLYGAAAALVFPKLFFPEASPVVGVLLAFSTYFVGFLARPLGAAIFGHIGDRVGRKKSLLATIILMGVGTVGIGLVPSYQEIGFWGPALLVFLRSLQGIGVGGEWGGAVLLAMESGSKGRQGFRGSFPQAAGTIGIGVANLAFLAVSLGMPTEAFMTWGWRIPFLASVILVFVGIWIRNGVPETAEFQKLKNSGRISKAPLKDLLRQSPVEILLAALLKSAEMIPVYIFIAFILSYGTDTLSYSRNTLLLLVSAAALISAAAMILAGHYSDRIGHERTFILGACVMAVFGFVYFAVIDSGSLVGAALVILFSLIPYAAMFAPEPVLIANNFPAETRYSGSSLGFNLAGIIGGGPAPFIATWLVTQYGSMAVATYIAVFCLIGVAAAKGLSRRARRRAATPPVTKSDQTEFLTAGERA